jgi:hypothetical protein
MKNFLFIFHLLSCLCSNFSKEMNGEKSEIHVDEKKRKIKDNTTMMKER